MKQKNERKFYLREYRVISHAISTYEDLNLLFQHLVEGLCRTFGLKGSSILLYDDKEKELFRISSYGLSDEYLAKGSLYMDDELDEFMKGEIVLYANIKNSRRVQYADAAIKEGIVSIFAVPIKCRKLVIGMLKGYQSEPILMHEDDIESIKVLLQQLGLVIENNGMKNFMDSVKAAMSNLPHYITEGH